MVTVVNELVNKLGLEHFVIGGNSMGGSIALRYALDHPNKITGLVLINSSGFMRTRFQNDDSQGVLAFRLLKNPWFRAIGEVMDPYYFVSQGLEAAFHQQAVVTEAMVMRYYDLALREGTRKATMKRFSAPKDKKYQAQDLARINVPTLLMWGKEDAIAPFAFASGYETLIPGISTAYYDGVGHIPMEEVPEISAADLIAFMEKINGQDK
jgi:pimeloyl-ACP methyl ester carboxylesterase